MRIMPYSSTADGLDVEYRVVDPSDYSEVAPLTAAVPGETNEYLTATAIAGGLRVLWYEGGVFQVSEDVPEQPASIAQAIREELAAELANLDAKVSDAVAAATSIPSPTGPGADRVTLHLGPLAGGAEVWISTDAAGENVIAGTLVANDAGDVTFDLDAGETYYRWAKKPPVQFTNPQAFVAVAD